MARNTEYAVSSERLKTFKALAYQRRVEAETLSQMANTFSRNRNRI